MTKRRTRCNSPSTFCLGLDKTGRKNCRAAAWPRVENYGMKNFALFLVIALMFLVVACQKLEAPVPFDIATLDCYDYDPDDHEMLVEKLSEKLLVAISNAKIAAGR